MHGSRFESRSCGWSPAVAGSFKPEGAGLGPRPGDPPRRPPDCGSYVRGQRRNTL